MRFLDRRFRYFLSCASNGSFHAAAQQLGITQAAVSLSIRTLEQELKVKLFVRRPRGVELTEHGAALRMQLLVAEKQIAKHVAGAGSSPLKPPLRIGSVSHFGHTHYRQNRYHALITFVIDGNAWKIKKIELIDEKRVL